MSLDIYLEGPEREVDCECLSCGNRHKRSESDTLYESNITHNLNQMAGEAGIYRELWRPDEIGVIEAAQLVEPLRAGIDLLKSDPLRFKAFNPSNGWGDYEGLVRFAEAYLVACLEWPEANVRVSR